MSEILNEKERRELILEIYRESNLDPPADYLVLEMVAMTGNCTKEEILKMRMFIINYFPAVKGAKPADRKIIGLGNRLSIADIKTYLHARDRAELPCHIETMLSHLLLQVKRRDSAKGAKAIRVYFDTWVFQDMSIKEIRDWVEYVLTERGDLPPSNRKNGYGPEPFEGSIRFEFIKELS